MLAIALGGREASARLRARAHGVRVVSGVLIGLVALGLVFHGDDHLAKHPPAYTTFLQNKVEDSATVRRELEKTRGGGRALAARKTATPDLPDYGAAPPLHAGGAWINSRPLSIRGLRGHVVLVDFWT